MGQLGGGDDVSGGEGIGQHLPWNVVNSGYMVGGLHDK